MERPSPFWKKTGVHPCNENKDQISADSRNLIFLSILAQRTLVLILQLILAPKFINRSQGTVVCSSVSTGCNKYLSVLPG